MVVELVILGILIVLIVGLFIISVRMSKNKRVKTMTAASPQTNNPVVPKPAVFAKGAVASAPKKTFFQPKIPKMQLKKLPEENSAEVVVELRSFVGRYAPEIGSEKVIRQLYELGFSEKEIKAAFSH